MAGQSLRVLNKNTYSALSTQLPANNVWLFPVAVNVPTAWAIYGTLALRCHAFSVGAGTGSPPSVRVLAYPSAATDEDPNTLYRSGTAVITGAKINGAASFTPSVDFTSNATPGNLGGSVDILLEIAQWVTTAGNLTVMVSCDLILKA